MTYSSWAAARPALSVESDYALMIYLKPGFQAGKMRICCFGLRVEAGDEGGYCCLLESLEVAVVCRLLS